MSETDDLYRQLNDEERARLLVLRDRLWSDFNDDDKVSLREGSRLASDDWLWLQELLATTVLRAETAQGLTTPNPFVLCLEIQKAEGCELLLMIHPTQLPEALSMEDTRKIFRALESPASRPASV